MTADELAAKMLVRQRQYLEGAEVWSGLRCGLSDASHLCDQVANDLTRKHTTPAGRVTKRGQELAEVARDCANAIWLMYEAACPKE